MEKQRPPKKKLALLVICLLAALIAVIFYFTNRTPDYENGIHVRFEDDLTAKQELSILAQYDGAVILDADDAVPHDFTLTFPQLSEREVKNIVSSLCKTEGVRDASYVRVISLPEQAS
mgnify:FL=1